MDTRCFDNHYWRKLVPVHRFASLFLENTVRRCVGLRLVLRNCLYIATIISLRPGIFAQDLFNPNKLPSDWMSTPILRARLLTLAGNSAVNCGRAPQPSRLTGFPTPADVTDCALKQLASKRSFYARYDLGGFDSQQTIGFAFNGEKLYIVTWQLTTWSDKQMVDVEECPHPIQLMKTRSGRLNCFSGELNESSGLQL